MFDFSLSRASPAGIGRCACTYSPLTLALAVGSPIAFFSKEIDQCQKLT